MQRWAIGLSMPSRPTREPMRRRDQALNNAFDNSTGHSSCGVVGNKGSRCTDGDSIVDDYASPRSAHKQLYGVATAAAHRRQTRRCPSARSVPQQLAPAIFSHPASQQTRTRTDPQTAPAGRCADRSPTWPRAAQQGGVGSGTGFFAAVQLVCPFLVQARLRLRLDVHMYNDKRRSSSAFLEPLH